MNQIREIFTEIACKNCYGKEDRQIFSTVNQLLTRHSFLNNHKAKLDPNVSKLCSACHVPEDTYHYIFTCDLFKNVRHILKSTEEDNLNIEGLNSISDINLKTFNGVIDDISKLVSNRRSFGQTARL